MSADLTRVTALAFLSGLALVVFLGHFSFRCGMLHRQKISCAGGIAISASFLLAAGIGLLRSGESGFFWVVLLALAVSVVLFGLLDDLRNLSVAVKFSFQIVLAIILIYLGVRTRIACLSDLMNVLVSFAWMLWMFNAFNLLDVMDGLAAAAAIVVSLGFAFVSPQGSPLALLSAALAASVLGFFFFNFPPARMYMGNSGSYFLGFVLGVISLLISYASKDKAVALAAPLLILGFPLLDTVFLVLIRLWLKKVPFQKSGDHICLRFLALGYSKRKTLVLLSGLCLFFVAGGIAAVHVNNAWGFGVLAVAVAASLKVIQKAAGVKVHEP